MRAFDRVIIADWSASSAPSPRAPAPDAIWVGLANASGVFAQYHRTRASAEAQLCAEILRAQTAGLRLLIGCDFAFGYPAGFAQALTGLPQAQAVWEWLARHITDGPANANNRFDVAGGINARFGTGPIWGPFWGRPAGRDVPHLPARNLGDFAALPFAQRREIERRIPRAQSVWKLFTTGAVGSQSLMGLPMIWRLSQMSGVSVWPFSDALSDVVLAEVYPSLLDDPVASAIEKQGAAAIKDQIQVQLLAMALQRQPSSVWAQMLALPHPLSREEGWILGHGFVPQLLAAL